MELSGDVRDLKQMLQALAHQAAPRRPWDPANTHTHTTNTVDGSGSAERLGSLGDLEADQSVKDEVGAVHEGGVGFFKSKAAWFEVCACTRKNPV